MISKFNVFNDFTNGNMHIGDTHVSFKGSISSETIDNDLVMEWEVASDGDSIELSGVASTTLDYDYDVDWGDGTTESNITINDKTHTYTTAGAYEVRIKSSSTSFALDMSSASASNRLLLKELKNWGNVALQSLANMFMYCDQMTYTATDYPNVTSLNASSTYKSARQMFRGCKAITTMDLSMWQDLDQLSRTTAWEYFAYDCEGLTTFNFSNFTASASCTSFQYFLAESGLTSGCAITMNDVSMTGVTEMRYFFRNIKISASPSLARWTLKNANGGTYAQGLFYTLKSLLGTGEYDLDLSTWTNTKCIYYLNNFMRGSDAIGELNLTGWDTSNVTNLSYAFYTNYQITKIEGLSGLSSASLTTCASMFYYTYKMSFPTATSNFGTAWATNLGAVNFLNFMGRCGYGQAGGYGLAPDVSNWDMSSVTNIGAMFSQSRFTSAIDPSGWDVSSITGSIGNFLYGNDGTTGTLDLSGWNFTNAVTNMVNFVRGAEITELIFSNSADFSGVTNMSYFAYTTSNLTTLTFGASVSFASVTTWTNAFTSITLDTTSYDAILVRNDATNSNTPVTLTGGNAKYTKPTSAPATARADLVALGWTILDGGATP